MSYKLAYRCTICNKKYPVDKELYTCPECGETGILDIEYDYKKIAEVFTKAKLSSSKEYSLWRYLPLLPVEESFTKNSLRVGWTPLYKFADLALKYNTKAIYIKDDGQNPTQSLKDRASVVACVKALELNQKVISCSSTGNAASSLAGNAAKMGLKTVIFVPERAPIGKLTQIQAFGSQLIKVKGDYKAAYEMSKAAINHFGFYNRNAAINPNLIEGKKTVALEIAEQLNFKPTEWIVVSVGDGCTIGGVYKGFYDLFNLNFIKKIPKILGVQSSGCNPFYQAYKNNLDYLEETDELTVADSISVGIPRNPVKGLNAVKKSQGAFIEVSDEEILSAIKELASQTGIFAEPAAAASFAGFKKARRKALISSEEEVTIIITGNGLKDPNNARKVLEEPLAVEPVFEEIKHILNIERRT